MGAANPDGSLVVLVTGASSGIGAACAARLAADGHRVHGACRSGRGPEGGAGACALDVTSDASVQAGVDALLAKEGRIDVLVNCAGYGLAGAVEHVTLEEAKAQFEVNFFGYLRMAKAVMPGMRARRSGLIVNISSLGGLVGLPFQSIYSATKFAVEGWSEGLALELRPDGVDVALVQPGDIRTAFTANRLWAAAARGDESALGRRGRAVLSIVERDESGGPPAEAVARSVSRLVSRRPARLRHPVGLLSQRLALRLKQWMPQAAFHSALSGYYGLRSSE